MQISITIEVVKMYEKIMENKGIIIAVCLVLLVAGIGTIFLCRKDVHDNGKPNDNIAEQLDAAEEEQRNAEKNIRSAESGLDASINLADRASRGLDDAQATTDRITNRNSQLADAAESGRSGIADGKSIIDDSQRRIIECQQILSRVQKDSRENGK